MKKISAIACLTMIMVMLTASLCFATDTFRITSTYPKDGATNTTKDNMCVKVYFNKPVGNATSKAANNKEFTITNSSGKTFPVRITYSTKNDRYALILVDTIKVPTKGSNAIKDNTVYACTISKNFQANDGSKLGTDQVIKFKTMNQARNTSIYMVMMVIMFGGMFAFSAKQMKKQREDDKKGEVKDEAFNPYKEAKRTGKSVEEIMAKHEKDKEKRAAHKKAKAKLQKEMDDMLLNEEEYFRVHKARPISSAGCTYKTGRSSVAEAKKAEEEAKKAELKATNYGKGPKDSKKKK